MALYVPITNLFSLSEDQEDQTRCETPDWNDQPPRQSYRSKFNPSSKQSQIFIRSENFLLKFDQKIEIAKYRCIFIF